MELGNFIHKFFDMTTLLLNPNLSTKEKVYIIETIF